MGWDQILVYLIVAAAGLYLASGYFGKRKKTGCGTGCGDCPASPAEPKKPLVDLVQLETRPHKRADG